MFQSSVIVGFSSVFSSFETSAAGASYGSVSSIAGVASASTPTSLSYATSKIDYNNTVVGFYSVTPSLMVYSISIEAVGTYTVVALASISALYRAFSSSYNFFLNATAS
jgi:hypothetical protein